MTTTSFPAVGDQGLTAAQWSVLYGTDDGIVEDYHTGGVEACVLTRSGDVGTVSPGKVKINGYILSIDTPTALNMPAVTVAVDYYVCAMYDDTLNVELAGTTNADPAGPCRLIVSAGAPAASSSKAYYVLYIVSRAANQALTAAVVSDERSWTAATRSGRKRPATTTGIPRGTHFFSVNAAQSGQVNHWVADVNAAGTGLGWKNLTGATAITFPFVGNFGARSATTAPDYSVFAGCMVKFRGDAQKNGGGNMGTKSGSVTIGQMPPTFRPKFTERFICKTSGTDGQAEVRVESTGEVTVSQTGGDITWINLSPVTYRAEL